MLIFEITILLTWYVRVIVAMNWTDILHVLTSVMVTSKVDIFLFTIAKVLHARSYKYVHVPFPSYSVNVN